MIKNAVLQQARESIEVIRLLIRLMKDFKQINLKRFVTVNQKVEAVSKQLAGWQKSKKQKFSARVVRATA